MAATRAREAAEAALMRAEVQAARADQRAEQQAARHEERLTELHSVIAELGRQLERHRATVIAEEDESGKVSATANDARRDSAYRFPSPEREGDKETSLDECHGQYSGERGAILGEAINDLFSVSGNNDSNSSLGVARDSQSFSRVTEKKRRVSFFFSLLERLAYLASRETTVLFPGAIALSINNSRADRVDAISPNRDCGEALREIPNVLIV